MSFNQLIGMINCGVTQFNILIIMLGF